MLRAAGAIDEAELLSYRRLRSRLEGHPTPRLPWVDVATGSLGQGLPIAAGLAMAGKSLDKLPYRIWVLCGDGELTEGSTWEAAEQAASCRLDNLTVIVDVNRLGQRGPTRHGWDTGAYAARFRAFGWHTQQVDGHDMAEIDHALAVATAHQDAPSVILARTRKGRGVAAVEDAEGAHGKPLPEPEQAIRDSAASATFASGWRRRSRCRPPGSCQHSGRGPCRCGGRPPTSRAPWSRRAPPSVSRLRSSATRGLTSSSWTAR